MAATVNIHCPICQCLNHVHAVHLETAPPREVTGKVACHCGGRWMLTVNPDQLLTAQLVPLDPATSQRVPAGVN